MITQQNLIVALMFISNLSMMVLNIHAINSLGCPCPECDYTAAHKTGLNIHINSIHKVTKYQCRFCEFICNQNSHLNRHVNSIHKGIKHPCPYCEFKTPKRKVLQVHIESIHSYHISMPKLRL